MIFLCILLGGCGLKKRIFSIVTNKFSIVEGMDENQFEKWVNTNLFILRLELEEGNKVEYNQEGQTKIELTDYPVKDYKLLTKPEWGNKKVVEEVYLYLHNFSDTRSGRALYMSSMPLMPKTSELIFCNNFFISTYGVNHLMTGNWELNGDKLAISLKDKKEELILKGSWISQEGLLEFTHTIHPKSLKKNDKRLIEIKDVFEVNPVKVSNPESLPNEGIRFFQNTNRITLHPDWNELGERFNFEKNLKYYEEAKENRKITKIYVPDETEGNVFLMLEDNFPKSNKNMVIKYRP